MDQQKYDDEIDLFELAQTIWRGKWTVVIITAVFVIIGVAYSLLAQQQWASKAVVTTPPISSVTPIYNAYQIIENTPTQGMNFNRSITIDSIQERVFNQFVTSLQSEDVITKIIESSDVYKNKLSQSQVNSKILMKSLIQNFKIEEVNKSRGRYSLQTLTDTGENSRKLLAHIVEGVSKYTREYFKKDIESLVSRKKDQTQKDMKVYEVFEGEKRKVKFTELKNAYSIAKASNIPEPVGRISASSAPITSQLFLYGYKALNQMIKGLEKTPLTSSSEYLNFKKTLLDIESYNFDETKISVFEYLKSPSLEIGRVKPKRRVIVILSVLMGLMVGVVLALALKAISNKTSAMRL